VGNPITKGTSLGLPPFGIGSMSIGENVNGNQIVIAINDGRMVVGGPRSAQFTVKVMF
jgi:hypothetical protein